MTLGSHWKRHHAPKVKARSFCDLIGVEMTPERTNSIRRATARPWSVDTLASVLLRQLRLRTQPWLLIAWDTHWRRYGSAYGLVRIA